MIIWKPPAMKIFLASMVIGAVLMFIFQGFMNIGLARNLGLMIGGAIMVVWDLRYKKSANRRWDDVSVSSFYGVLPTFLAGGLIVVALLISQLVSGDYSSAFVQDEFGLPWAARQIVLNNAEKDAKVISAQLSTTDQGLWCIVTQTKQKLEYWTVSSDNILTKTSYHPSGYDYGCDNWHEITPP
jgi:hypothetical protein